MSQNLIALGDEVLEHPQPAFRHDVVHEDAGLKNALIHVARLGELLGVVERGDGLLDHVAIREAGRCQRREHEDGVGLPELAGHRELVRVHPRGQLDGIVIVHIVQRELVQQPLELRSVGEGQLRRDEHPRGEVHQPVDAQPLKVVAGMGRGQRLVKRPRALRAGSRGHRLLPKQLRHEIIVEQAVAHLAGGIEFCGGPARFGGHDETQ